MKERKKKVSFASQNTTITWYKKNIILSERQNNFASNSLKVCIFKNALQARPDLGLHKISKNQIIVIGLFLFCCCKLNEKRIKLFYKKFGWNKRLNLKDWDPCDIKRFFFYRSKDKKEKIMVNYGFDLISSSHIWVNCARIVRFDEKNRKT